MKFRQTATGMTAAIFALSMGLAVAQQNQTGTTTPNQTGTSTTGSAAQHLNSTDKKFMMNAARGGLAEVELGKLAAQNGGSDAVKQFGQQMVDDHSKANDQLMQLASQKNVTLPKGISKKDQMLKNRLSKLTGAAFDKVYMSDMVKDHQGDIHNFQYEADQGQDPDVKAFATSTLPTLKKHLTMAQDVYAGKGMPVSTSTNSSSGAGTPNSTGSGTSH